MEEIDRHFHCCILHLEVTNTSKKLYCFEANYILYPVWIWLSTMSFLVAIIHILMWAVYINIIFLVLHNLKKVNLLFWTGNYLFSLFILLYICSFQNFLIDIKGPAMGFLPVLAFEGGTRRNIPKFEVWILSVHVSIYQPLHFI